MGEIECILEVYYGNFFTVSREDTKHLAQTYHVYQSLVMGDLLCPRF